MGELRELLLDLEHLAIGVLALSNKRGDLGWCCLDWISLDRYFVALLWVRMRYGAWGKG